MKSASWRFGWGGPVRGEQRQTHTSLGKSHLHVTQHQRISAADLATAVPEPMAIPISAFFKAGASFTPSPVCDRQTANNVTLLNSFNQTLVICTDYNHAVDSWYVSKWKNALILHKSLNRSSAVNMIMHMRMTVPCKGGLHYSISLRIDKAITKPINRDMKWLTF